MAVALKVETNLKVCSSIPSTSNLHSEVSGRDTNPQIATELTTSWMVKFHLYSENGILGYFNHTSLEGKKITITAGGAKHYKRESCVMLLLGHVPYTRAV